MAEIIYGMGVSHSPHLSTPPEQWDRRAVADKRNPAHPFRGGTYTFDELVELRKGENLAARCNLDVYRELDAKNQARLKQLADRFARPRRTSWSSWGTTSARSSSRATPQDSSCTTATPS